MSKNIDQIFIANPASNFNYNDLFYLGRSPYGVGNDMAAQYLNLMSSLCTLVTGTTYTIGFADIYSVINVFNSVGGLTINLPQQNSVALPQGFKFFVANTGILDAVLSVGGSDSIVGVMDLPAGTFSTVTLVKVSSGINTWVVDYEGFGYVLLSSANNISITTPVNVWTDINISTTGKSITLPDTRFGAMQEGKIFYFRNAGSNAFSIIDSGSGTVLSALNPGDTVQLINTTNSSSAGNFVTQIIYSTALQTREYTIFIPTCSNATFYFSPKAAIAGTLTQISGVTSSGTCTVNAAINGVNVTGTALSASNSITSQTITANNVFSIGNAIEAVITSNSVGLNLALSLVYTVSI